MAKSKKTKRFDDAVQNFNQSSQPFPDQYDDEVFDALDPWQMADDDATIPIWEIVPDMTQPRHILPAMIRAEWDGNPRTYGDVLEAWEDEVLEATDGSFPTQDLLRGKVAISDYVIDESDAIVARFGNLVGLAANIRDIGLNHPIGVVKRGDFYRIVYGERRWTAFQLLRHYLNETTDQWRSIPAKIANVSDWELAKMQTAENNQHDPLNAIAKARNFAKLVITARQEAGETYDSWNALVVDCDRPYWAQVANGDIHRIPRGMGTQFEQVLNISTDTMRKYRMLLKLTDNHQINDAIWILGDLGDWAEAFMRDIGQYLDIDEIHEILSSTDAYTVPAGTVSLVEEMLRDAVSNAKKAAELAKKQADRDASLFKADSPAEEIPVEALTPDPSPTGRGEEWPAMRWVGKRVWAGNDKVEVLEAIKEQTVKIRFLDGPHAGNEIPFHITSLVDTSLDDESDGDNADTPSPGAAEELGDKNGVVIEIGQTVTTSTGHQGKVVNFKGKLVEVEIPDNYYAGGAHYPNTLVVQSPLNPPASQEEGVDEAYLDRFKSGMRVVLMRDQGEHKEGEYGKVIEMGGKKGVLFDGHKFMTVTAPGEKKHVLHACAIDPYSDKTDPEKGAYPGHGLNPKQLWGKRVLFDGKVAVVVTAGGIDEVVIQMGKERLTVHKDLLTVDEDSKDQPAVEVLGTSTDSKNAVPTQDDPADLVLPIHSDIRRAIGQVRYWATMFEFEESESLLGDLLKLKKDDDADALGEQFDEVYAHCEDICAAFLEHIHDEFTTIIEQVRDGAS